MHLEPIIYGQFISITLSSCYIFNQLVNTAGIFSSLFPNEVIYHILFLVCLFKAKHIYTIYKNARRKVWGWAIVLGVLDVTSNTAMLKSFQYTSGISAVLISSTSAVFAVPLCYIFLGQRYNRKHLFGLLIVVLGLVFINYSKYADALSKNEQVNFEFLGSLLAGFASFGFACLSIIQTLILRDIDQGYPWGSLAAYGVVSSIISAIVANATELGQIDRDSLIQSKDPRALFSIGLILASTIFYLMTPLYLQKYSAINFQMSLLTSDLGVYLFNVFYLKIQLHPLYVTGFFCVLGGLAIFNLAHGSRKTAEIVLDDEQPS